jgi:hypothetical protein
MPDCSLQIDHGDAMIFKFRDIQPLPIDIDPKVIDPSVDAA